MKSKNVRITFDMKPRANRTVLVSYCVSPNSLRLWHPVLRVVCIYSIRAWRRLRSALFLYSCRRVWTDVYLNPDNRIACPTHPKINTKHAPDPIPYFYRKKKKNERPTIITTCSPTRPRDNDISLTALIHDRRETFDDIIISSINYQYMYIYMYDNLRAFRLTSVLRLLICNNNNTIRYSFRNGIINSGVLGN